MAILTLIAFLPFALFGQPAEIPAEQPQNLHGIYLTSQTVAGPNLDKILDDFSKVGGNMIVFDIQDSGGHLAYSSNIPISIEIGNRGSKISDLPALVKKIREKGFYTVSRFVLFKNGFLAAKKPQWTLKKKGTARPFFSREGAVWLDPGNPELKEYLIDIGRELAIAGVDEIQFDYVRFTESGNQRWIPYSYTGDAEYTRDQTITNFISSIASEMHILQTKVSVDVFGIVVWDNISWKVIGQNVGELAKHVDALYPMPYPSHFGRGYGGHKNPADEPYYFVQETTKKFLAAIDGSKAQVRPWLQGFAMNVSKYGSWYIADQIRALSDIGVMDYTVWNARNDYFYTYKALGGK